jgi:hypothetical protein
MKELRIEHKKNERLIFGKTNPILEGNRVLRGYHLFTLSLHEDAGRGR